MPLNNMDIETIYSQVLDCAFTVHSELGPGLLESTYEACLFYEITQLGLFVERQKALPVKYKEIELDAGYRIDLLVENCIIVELKCVESLMDIHTAQTITYLKLSGYHLGLLVNFNSLRLKNGIKRLIL